MSTPHTSATAPAATLLEDVGFVIVDEASIPARAARLAPVPTHLHPKVRAALSARYPNGLYRHQVLAIDALLNGEHVTLSTPTASGKTLAFVAHAAHMLLTSKERGTPARVLALYPAKALIQDQLGAWRELLDGLGLRVVIADGSVDPLARGPLIAGADVVLMTPDAAHAWLLRVGGEKIRRAFLDQLRLLVLDEAHSYDGAFGTNMAHFLRRVTAIAGRHQVVASTATLSDAATFVEALTGRVSTCIGAADDGSEAPTKSIVIVQHADEQKGFDGNIALVRRLASGDLGRFLVFADSRKLVEMTVAAVHRRGDEVETTDDAAEPDIVLAELGLGSQPGVLPYRAGYEECDRRAIQDALTAGRLVGVVATSALELGIDIGAMECVVLLAPPPSMKSFWQRFGRAGRRSTPGLCILIDDEGVIERASGIDAWCARPIEPSRLYLKNRYIQYGHALCAAAEITEVGRARVDFNSFASLPPEFRAHVENELDPKHAVEPDLYALKQRGAQPHLEFPLRRATDKSFEVQMRGSGQRKGELTHPQMLREAYPGAVYHYLARPFRVSRVDERKGICECHPARGLTTRPTAQTTVFPRFANGALQLSKSDRGFVCEAELQVSERVVGFTEIRGAQRVAHEYGPMSPWSQRPLQRFFETSGVCWWERDGVAASERVAGWIRSAFCERFGVQDQDVGVGLFHAQAGPAGLAGVFKGACIYDATNGSLRLTSILAANFVEVVDAAIGAARAVGEDDDAEELERLRDTASGFAITDVESGATQAIAVVGDGVVDVVAPGEVAMYVGGAGPEELTVVGIVYTARGLFYEVEPPTRDSKRRVAAAQVVALAGRTRMARFDTMTLEFVGEGRAAAE
ncbi:MAG: DEAD/DEAH box helicase [Polyangiales bacterium]